jgi:hypothetical protein
MRLYGQHEPPKLQPYADRDGVLCAPDSAIVGSVTLQVGIFWFPSALATTYGAAPRYD